ncbi:MAG: sel1 repeat family protein [Alphaproteobacteria bacterium]|nr:sel1 repeat family protein [Alphaproteobacteria bacterium]
MGVKSLALASLLVVAGNAAAQAQQQGGFLFEFSFFAKPVPPADIPDPSADGGRADGSGAAALRPVPPEPLPGVASKVDAGTVPMPDPALPITLETVPATAADAALALASPSDPRADARASDTLSALQAAAEDGQPIAMWRLGTMYETGEGVEKDEVRAFGYYSRLADENASTPPSSLEAGIVARSFVKVGEYYREGLPDAGIPADSSRSVNLLMHAATYFGDAEAQYEIGRLYLSGDGIGRSALQGARWLSLAARKGHVAAQATLGDLLFNGDGERLPAQPIEGLMWLTIARDHNAASADSAWVEELLNEAMSVATPNERSAALAAAAALGPSVSDS